MRINERQEKLYELLLSENRWFSKEDITVRLTKYYNRFIECVSEHNSSAYHCIRDDVRALNDCEKVDKIIVSSQKGYKIANKEEAEEYIKKRFARDYKSLKLNYKLVRKCQLNGQIDIDFKEYSTFMKG